MVEKKIKELIKEDIENIGITLKDVKYEEENGIFYLRIFIDKEPFINIDDCVEVTNIVNPILDKSDFLKNSYILDISSIEKGESNE